jgi:hypothetical protein
LKKQKSGWDEKFERGKYTLNVMKPVQGRHFAICYGEVDYSGTRALLLSEVGGHALNASNATEIDADALRRMLHEAIRNANEYLVEPPETKLEHFHEIDDHIVMLDWEGKGDITKEDAEYCRNSSVEHLMLMPYHLLNSICYGPVLHALIRA